MGRGLKLALTLPYTPYTIKNETEANLKCPLFPPACYMLEETLLSQLVGFMHCLKGLLCSIKAEDDLPVLLEL
ncbi:hypothetical protein DAPPUDRAFT_246560 [Daphnia pulex]|uniref:Uncharacterized protein n=1 Tax=Daphnia pulex TaxID=6669 RepID=E9GQV3_DAPPU|nr:hypothetical protein DAPPUDRAFT_246560 [Daphnia pulex]|eukprot:EFX78178.1 hypothetical protein DAPPUDRAFT_246560 [Daphnia pulex]